MLNSSQKGYQVARNKTEMENCKPGAPVMAVFHEDGLPYTLDQKSDTELLSTIPTLADMTRKALSQLSNNPSGFVLQVRRRKSRLGSTCQRHWSNNL